MNVVHDMMRSIFAGWEPKKIKEHLIEVAEEANLNLHSGHIELEDFKLVDGNLHCFFNYMNDSDEVVDSIDYKIDLLKYPLDKLESYIKDFSQEIKTAFEEDRVQATDDYKYRYRFDGTAYYQDRPLGQFNLETVAYSEKAAIRNFKYQIIKQIGHNARELNNITFSKEDIILEDVVDPRVEFEEKDEDMNLESDPRTSWGYVD